MNAEISETTNAEISESMRERWGLGNYTTLISRKLYNAEISETINAVISETTVCPFVQMKRSEISETIRERSRKL